MHAHIYARVRTLDRIYAHAIRANKRSNDAYTYIVHPESFRSNAQIAIAFASRNCPRVHRNDEFACALQTVLIWSRPDVIIFKNALAYDMRAFAFVCEYCSRSTACAYAPYVRTCAT